MAETEKEGQTKPKFSRRKELIYTQVEIKDTHTHTHTHTHEWFFEKINKIDQPLVRLIMKKRSPKWKVKNKREVTTNTIETWKIIRDYYTQLHAYSAMSKSLQPHGLQPTMLLCLWDSPGQNTGVGCCFLLQGISFLTTYNLPWFMDLTFQVPLWSCFYRIGLSFHQLSHRQLDIVFAALCTDNYTE